ncbi:MAG: tetratricopeptide repeat protein [Verrucomicrobiaceae bacterium]|nr:tetratricopeptide repeat protein [Verrucomicrobiaceae bacterium]
MTPFRTVLYSLALLLAATGLALGQATTIAEQPGDTFFRAYLLGNDADKLSKSGEHDRALEKFGQALAILDSLAKNYPTWQPEMIRFRRGKITDSQEAAQAAKSKAQQAQAAPVAPPQPATPASNSVPLTAFGTGMASAVTPQPSAIQIPSGPTTLNDAFAIIQKALTDEKATLAAENQKLMAKVGEMALAYEAATGRLNEYVTAYQTLTKAATEQQGRISELEKSSTSNAQAKTDLEKLRQEKSETDAMLSDARDRVARAEKAVMDQSKQLMAATDKFSALQKERDSLAKEKELSEAERAKLAKDVADLKSSLEKAEKNMAAVTKERDTLNTEIIGLKAMEGKGVSEGMKKLVEENQRLKTELTAAKKQVDILKADITKKDAEIASIKGDLSKLQGELAALKKQNADYETQVADLTIKIKELNSTIAAVKDPKSDPQLTAENQLLRSIIMRQLRIQARQQVQNEAVIREVKSMENASKTLLEEVEALDDNRFVLSQEEQKLFTTPQLQEMMGGGEGLQGTIVAEANAKAGSSITKPVSAEDAQKKIVADLLAKGNTFLQDGKLAEAATAYQDALRADPKNIDAFLGLGWAQVQLGKNEDAEVSMRKALAHDAKNSMAHYMLGVSLFRRDRVNDAMTSFEKSLELNPKNARARHYLGVIANRMNLPQRAEKEFKSALAIDPTYGEANFNLAVLYATWEPPKWDEARSQYDEALKKGVKPNADLEKLLKPGSQSGAEKAKTAAVQ